MPGSGRRSCRLVSIAAACVLGLSFGTANAAGENSDRTSATPSRPGLVFTAASLKLEPLLATPPVTLSVPVLSDDDVRLYRAIFAAQDSARFDEADAAIRRLDDPRLLGHVLADRYLHPKYKTSVRELLAWLGAFGDLPQADALRKLARTKGGADLTLPPPPDGLDRDADEDEELRGMPVSTRPVFRAAKASVRSLLRQDAWDKAEARVAAAAPKLTAIEQDALSAELAAGLYYAGEPARAGRIAKVIADRSGEKLPLAHWIAGLSAWTDGEVAEAGRHFESVGRNLTVSPWMQAGGAYWAARAHMLRGQSEHQNYWLTRAAAYPQTFYGLLALRALGRDQAALNAAAGLGQREILTLSASPAGRRALGLIQLGDKSAAGDELRAVVARGSDPATLAAATAAAQQIGLSAMSLQVSASAATDHKEFPIPRWQPNNGFIVDPALVYALIRQESGFDPRLRNRGSGATGLMQLMPQTAAGILGRRSLNVSLLLDPGRNMELGQRYINHLMTLDDVGRDLLKVTAAYNAGPGRLGRWLKESEVDYQSDPLLFIESIPVRETRQYVQKVLANYWLYQLRLHGEAPSLESLAAGLPPLYVAPRAKPVQLAESR